MGGDGECREGETGSCCEGMGLMISVDRSAGEKLFCLDSLEAGLFFLLLFDRSLYSLEMLLLSDMRLVLIYYCA